MRYQRNFPELLEGVPFDTLEEHPSAVYALSDSGRIIYVNPAYLRFAEQNGVPDLLERFPLGTPVTDFVPSSLSSSYLQKYHQVMKKGEVWSLDYDCSSPESLRTFHQSNFPLKNGTGVVIINWLRVEVSRAPAAEKVDVALYLQDDGFVHQCCNCKNVLRRGEEGYWETVETWRCQVPLNTSHTICPVCFEYYWRWPAEKQRSQMLKCAELGCLKSRGISGLCFSARLDSPSLFRRDE